MSETPTRSATIKIKIDGNDCLAFPGESVLEAALRLGVFVPHYCWHPGLSIAGNCRMCLVYIKPGPPKPQIACNTVVRDGMEVESASERVKEDREGVMSFLLANHPLDCPVCDQAGECDLQQYSFDHGRSESHFSEQKTQRPRKDLGPLIRYNGNRCIVCTRCVRFTDEVTETKELAVVNRSDSSWIDVFPGEPLDNPLSGCTADLCPVGALLETDSMHTSRVWLHRGTKSVCAGCATGCNVNVETFDGQVKRLTPRENQPVNRWWMCDEGRLSHRERTLAGRLTSDQLNGAAATPSAALTAAQDLLNAALVGTKDEGQVVGLTTGFASNEELYLLLSLVGQGAMGVSFRAEGRAFTATDGFHMAADKNPNRAGVAALLGDVVDTARVEKAIRSGGVQVVLLHDSVPGGAPWSESLLEAIAESSAAVIRITQDAAGAVGATVAFGASHFTEKDGTYVNRKGRLQRVRAALTPPGGLRTDLEVLQELARGLGRVPRVVSAGGVFRRMAAALPTLFGDMSYQLIGEVGLPLAGAEDQTPPDECRTGYEAGPTSRSPGRAKDEQTRIAVHRESAAGYGTAHGRS